MSVYRKENNLYLIGEKNPRFNNPVFKNSYLGEFLKKIEQFKKENVIFTFKIDEYNAIYRLLRIINSNDRTYQIFLNDYKDYKNTVYMVFENKEITYYTEKTLPINFLDKYENKYSISDLRKMDNVLYELYDFFISLSIGKTPFKEDIKLCLKNSDEINALLFIIELLKTENLYYILDYFKYTTDENLKEYKCPIYIKYNQEIEDLSKAKKYKTYYIYSLHELSVVNDSYNENNTFLNGETIYFENFLK